ncbi:Cullin binding-domain-containing protein [Dichotomopilus funicola]|uniref:Defective in cullin neddylation protein n=1 Tax=Dichotomopilus funicola TaxID=1934379 RepID=A0AAN6ZIU6_9PEZI|nr:Cullin binding-domain-containing protein [Dichotomopilus funicola]
MRNFLRSFFPKPKQSPPSPPRVERSTETDSSDATLVAVQSSPSAPSPAPTDSKLPIREPGSDSETSTPHDFNMPRATKQKSTKSATPKGWRTKKKAQGAARYYNDTQGHPTNRAEAGIRSELDSFFNELIPSDERAQSSEPIPEIGAELSMAYIEELGVNMASYELFVVLEIVRAEAIGTITRSGFVDGWTHAILDSHSPTETDITAQRRIVRDRIIKAVTDSDYFKVLYDFAFQVGREPPQKAISMAVAVGFWEGLYEPSSNPWRSANVDWLVQWTTYLKEKFGVVKTGEDGEEEIEYKRTVSKDLWTQTRLFAAKTMKDETLGFWSEEQAWPGLIDEFVLWCREKGVVATGTE